MFISWELRINIVNLKNPRGTCLVGDLLEIF